VFLPIPAHIPFLWAGIGKNTLLALLMLRNFTADAASFHRLIAVVSWRCPVLASDYSISAV
jgi:hypothetical protein